MKRICKKCNIEKDFETKFPKSGWSCKACVKIKNRKYQDENKERVALMKKLHKERYAKKYKEYQKEYGKKWREENSERIKEVTDEWYKNNRERLKPVRKAWAQKNSEKVREKAREFYYTEKGKEGSTRRRKRFLQTPYGILTNRLSSLINRLLKDTPNMERSNIESFLGWSKLQFLESVGCPNKDNNIDHKVPLSWFKKDTPFVISCHINNLHLISKFENLHKYNLHHHPISEEYKELIKPYIKEEFKNKIYEYKEQVNN